MTGQSESIAELAAALVTAQAEIAPAEKDARGNYGTYTTLRSVWEACKAALHKNGFAVLQFAEPSEPGTLSLSTMLLHKSGQWVVGTECAPLQKNDPQGYGSCMTYLRRYGLAAMVGVCPDDDDGAAASQKTPPRARTSPPARQETPPRQSGDSRVLYADMKVREASPIAHRWFMAKLKEDHEVSYEQAKKLLDVDSISEQFPDHTLGQVLGFVGMAKLRQQKARANDA